MIKKFLPFEEVVYHSKLNKEELLEYKKNYHIVNKERKDELYKKWRENNQQINNQAQIKNKGNIFNKEFIFFIASLLIASFLAFEISPQIQERVKSFQSTFSSKGDRMSGRFTVYEESFDRFKTAILKEL